jgi:hypothetical protein
MKEEAARALVLSLIERLNSKFNGKTATVEMTAIELQALSVLTADESLQGDELRNLASAEQEVTSVPPTPVAITTIDWSKYVIEPITTHRMCIDFGTAFSKVALVGEDDDIKPLAIGRLAGDFESPLTVPSSVLIHEGRMFFGRQAVQKSEASEVRHRRIDGLKQFLSKGEISDIDEQVLSPEYSDGAEGITKGVVLRMFCAYLTALAEKQAENHTEHDDVPLIGRQIPRRFARPAWDPKKSEAAKAFMAQVLFEGCVIADYFKGRWGSGLDIKEVLRFLSELEKHRKDLSHEKLIQEDVLEATAAANAIAGGFSDFEGRRLVLVVDTGAGTTDFGAFQVFTRDETVRIVEITDCRKILRQAGDTLDEAIALILFQKLGHIIGSDSESFERANINNRRRTIKEVLFASGSYTYTGVDDVPRELVLEEVLASEMVVQFSQSLRKKFDECLGGLDPETVKARGGVVSVVLTGGGASLPMVKALLDPNGAVHRCRQLSVDEDWLRSIDPELPRLFPQLAVAIGGAFPTLPTPIADVSALAATEAKNWTVTRFQ